MEYKEAKDKFIQAWGTFGTEWGVNRTMAQIHALLLVASAPLSAEDIMEDLQISRGNANMNIRALIDWGLVFKELKPGDRKEYFYAEKEMWEVLRKIIMQRKKKELEPVVKILNEVTTMEGTDESSLAFKKAVTDINQFAKQADSALDMLVKSDANWFVATLLKVMK